MTLTLTQIYQLLINAAPALFTNYQMKATEVTTIGSRALDLKRQVRKVTRSGSVGINNQAKSDEALKYQINDTTPPCTTFISALDGPSPATLTPCQKHTAANPSLAAAVMCSTPQVGGGTGGINFKFNTRVPNPGGTGSVLFQVMAD